MQTTIDKPVIGITTGDLNGVGLEVIIKTFSDPRMLEFCVPVIFASNKVINYYRRITTDNTFNFSSTKDLTKLNPKQINIFNCWEDEIALQPGVLTETGGKYAVRSLLVAAQCLKDGQLDGIVTAPINKANTSLPDFPYTGHTPFFKDKFGAKDVLMLLFSDSLRVGLVTEHLPIAKVPAAITRENVLSKYNLMKESLSRDFGIERPKIAILGLNPHAGDEGQIGNEEQTVLKPLIEQLKNQGNLVFGPYGADAFFARGTYTEFDGILAMYHDQGLVAFKTIAQGEGVNYTAGLSVVRTSPDHGTAFNIAGKNLADPTSFREAVFKCIDIINARREHAEYTGNPLRRGKIEKEPEN